MPAIDDAARKLADESLKALEGEYRRAYAQAAREMRAKLRKWLKGYEAELSQRLKALDDTPDAIAAHRAWLESQALRQQWLSGMTGELASRAVDANVLAMEALDDTLPMVYAESANWTAYAIDKAVKADTRFTLLDENTARVLMMRPGRLVKEVTFPKVDRPKDYRWNRQRFHQAITQGILQGESIPAIVKRTNSIFGSNAAAAYRAARTATTCAENAGRMASYERADDIGIEMVQEWVATMDGRTRQSHRELDGQQRAVGEPFETDLGPIMYPGDPSADPADVWNCRCTLRARVKGFEGERPARWGFLPDDVTYDEWKAGKDPHPGGGMTYAERMGGGSHA